MSAIRCPHCRHPVDMTDCEIYCRHTTYHAEDGPVERECDRCGASFYLQEHVRRTWSIGRSPEEARHHRAEEVDGRPD